MAGPLAEQRQVQLAFCCAYVRRRLYELAAAGPAPIPTEALSQIKALYAVEAEISGLEPGARQEKSLPLIQTLEPWLRTKLRTISEDQAGRGHPLRALTLGGPDLVPPGR